VTCVKFLFVFTHQLTSDAKPAKSKDRFKTTKDRKIDRFKSTKDRKTDRFKTRKDRKTDRF
jgi:hypothetical protein